MNINQRKLSIPKLKKIPRRIIYGDNNRFKIADTKSGFVLGELKVTPTKLFNHPFYQNTTEINALYINDLKVFEFARKQNVGTDLVNFAKRLAKTLNCEDRVYALAYNHEHPGEPPHVFWWKQGFITTSQEDNKVLKRAAKHNTGIPVDMYFGTTMFFNNKKP